MAATILKALVKGFKMHFAPHEYQPKTTCGCSIPLTTTSECIVNIVHNTTSNKRKAPIQDHDFSHAGVALPHKRFKAPSKDDEEVLACLKNINSSAASAACHSTQTENDSLEKRLLGAEQKADQATKNLSLKEEELRVVREQVTTAAQRELVRLRNQNAARSARIKAKCSNRVCELQDEISELQDHLGKANGDLQQARQDYSSCKRLSKQAQEHHATAITQLKEEHQEELFRVIEARDKALADHSKSMVRVAELERAQPDTDMEGAGQQDLSSDDTIHDLRSQLSNALAQLLGKESLNLELLDEIERLKAQPTSLGANVASPLTPESSPEEAQGYATSVPTVEPEYPETPTAVAPKIKLANPMHTFQTHGRKQAKPAPSRGIQKTKKEEPPRKAFTATNYPCNVEVPPILRNNEGEHGVFDLDAHWSDAFNKAVLEAPSDMFGRAREILRSTIKDAVAAVEATIAERKVQDEKEQFRQGHKIDFDQSHLDFQNGNYKALTGGNQYWDFYTTTMVYYVDRGPQPPLQFILCAYDFKPSASNVIPVPRSHPEDMDKYHYAQTCIVAMMPELQYQVAATFLSQGELEQFKERSFPNGMPFGVTREEKDNRDAWQYCSNYLRTKEQFRNAAKFWAAGEPMLADSSSCWPPWFKDDDKLLLCRVFEDEEDRDDFFAYGELDEKSKGDLNEADPNNTLKIFDDEGKEAPSDDIWASAAGRTKVDDRKKVALPFEAGLAKLHPQPTKTDEGTAKKQKQTQTSSRAPQHAPNRAQAGGAGSNTNDDGAK